MECRECGGGRVFDSYDQVLASDVDAVLISSPPEAHREQVVAALAAGKGVLVEKPLCATEADLEAIGAALCDDSLLMVAENYYYKPSLQVIKGIIGQGFIGEVQRVERLHDIVELSLQRHLRNVRIHWTAVVAEVVAERGRVVAEERHVARHLAPCAHDGWKNATQMVNNIVAPLRHCAEWSLVE